MPAVSKAQRRFMAMCEHSDHPPDRCPSMSKGQLHDFASTSESDLPETSAVRMTKKSKENLSRGYRTKE
jgi:hypothetical protein